MAHENLSFPSLQVAQRILDSVGEGLCAVDGAGVVTYINAPGAQMLGYLPHEMLGQVAHRLFHYAHPDGSPYPEDECSGRHALQPGLPHSVDHEFFWRKDGSGFPVHYVSAPMQVDGVIQGTVLTFRDTSHETATRKALVESQVKLRKAQEIAGIGSYIADLSTGLWESSPRLDAMLGLDARFTYDIPGWLALVDPDCRQTVADHFQKVASGACDFQLDYRIIRHCDGESRWVSGNGELERDAHGKPLRLIGTLQDITERRRTEAALQQSHDLLNKLSEEVPGVLFQIKMSAEGHFSVPFASQAIFDMFEVRAEDIVEDAGKIFATIPGAERQAVMQSLLHSARTLHNWVKVFQIALPSRGQRWRHGQARPVRQADGSTLWHGFIADATERMEAKNQLLQLNETLELRVLERTRELVTALDSAELAKRSRGQFLANMSHEIRTPMNTVMGMVHLALKTQPAPLMRQYLEKIQQSGSHLLAMINDILDFSKIDAGKLRLESETFDVESLLQHIIQLTEGKAQEKGLCLRLEQSPALPHFLRGDPLRLSQILLNYVNNAVKFTERGDIVLRALALPPQSQTTTVDSCRLRFEVQDTGIGVDQEHATRLFKSFEQGDNSTTRKFGGTGLGLAICRQLASLMGGSVGVRGALGQGSTFWMEVDLEIAPEPDYESLPQADVAGAVRAVAGRRVLVVDDNDFNLDVARGLLQDAAVTVEVAHDGQQAIEALLASPFDCVLMDVQMPTMDGLEATRRIRSHPKLRQMVVIAMTANAGQDDRRQCLDAGMNEVIIKPVDSDLLFLAMHQWLSQGAAGTATQQPAVAAEPVPVPPADVSLPNVDAWPAWDADALARVVGNNPSAHARLLDKYRRTASETVAEMLLCSQSGQWLEAAELAHKLKSSSRSVGAMRLGQLCEALEHAGRSGNAAASAALVQSVAAAFAVVDARIGA